MNKDIKSYKGSSDANKGFTNENNIHIFNNNDNNNKCTYNNDDDIQYIIYNRHK